MFFLKKMVLGQHILSTRRDHKYWHRPSPYPPTYPAWARTSCHRFFALFNWGDFLSRLKLLGPCGPLILIFLFSNCLGTGGSLFLACFFSFKRSRTDNFQKQSKNHRRPPHNFKNHVRENGNKGGKLRTTIGNNMITLVNDDSKRASPLAR